MNILITLVLAFVVMLAMIGAMAIGVMNGRKPVSGSCGGVGSSGCELCSGNGKCKREGAQ